MSEFFSKKRMLMRQSYLTSVRDVHLKDWQKITQVIRPARGAYLGEAEEASKRPTSMINSTPAVASRVLQAGMIGGAASPAYQWFKFELENSELGKWGPAKITLEQRELIVMKALSASNFYQSLQTVFGDSGDFGTGSGLIDRHQRDFFTAKVFSPGEYVIDINDAGDVDTFISQQKKTVFQLMGNPDWKKNVTAEVKDAYDKGNYNTKFDVVQVIEPNLDINEDRADWRGKPWVKFTFQKDNNIEGENGYLDISGYNEWPGFNLRWDLASGNMWGQGPGLLALGDAAALQTTEFRDAQLVEKAVKPPLQAPIFLKNKPVSHAPGGVTYYDPYTSNGAKVEPIYQVQAGILQAIDAKIARHEYRINEVYYKDLFMMLASTDRREITAREVEEKHEEKLIGLGPVLQRTHRDALGCALIRVYNILDAAGAFPPGPKELTDQRMAIRYTSALAYAQRSAGAASLERFFGFSGNLVQAYPQVAYKINAMKGMDHYAEAIGVPAEVMIETVEAEKAFAAAQQNAQAPQQAAMAKDVASGAQLLSQTDTSRPSALQFLLQRGGLQ